MERAKTGIPIAKFQGSSDKVPRVQNLTVYEGALHFESDEIQFQITPTAENKNVIVQRGFMVDALIFTTNEGQKFSFFPMFGFDGDKIVRIFKRPLSTRIYDYDVQNFREAGFIISHESTWAYSKRWLLWPVLIFVLWGTVYLQKN